MSPVLRDLRRGSAAVRFEVLPPLALYVHLPWCVRKCPYCDFNSHEAKGELPFAQYREALLRDLEALLPSVWGRRVTSIFIGGGTPSLFPEEEIDALLSAIRARIPVEPDAEVTLEANPGTAESSRFLGYREAGVNRLSLGVQSFDDTKLAALGRIHGGDEARRAIAFARDAFDNVNLDLMYGLPGQSLADARADIEEAVAAGTTHLSCYQLTLEPNTVFHSRPPALPDHDLAADMQDMVEATLAGAGFGHYEVSAFARPGRRCRHNLNYWEFGDYLGLGAGAHGKLSLPDRILRHEQPRPPKDYLAGAPGVSRELAVADIPFQFMLNALRLVEGVPEALFQARTGLPLALVQREIEAAGRRGLLSREAGRLQPTPAGRRFLNDLVEAFLPAEER